MPTLDGPLLRSYIEDAINQDPAILKKTIETQIDTLLIQPLHSASTQTIPLPQLVIIDATNVTIV
jgi:hypothetical protein